MTPGSVLGTGMTPPSDATVLFDGRDLSQWKGKTGAAAWDVKDGVVTVKKGTGDIETIRWFKDIRLHIDAELPRVQRHPAETRTQRADGVRRDRTVRQTAPLDSSTHCRRGRTLSRLRRRRSEADDPTVKPNKRHRLNKSQHAKPLCVEDLAKLAGMSVSTLHHHFRALTAKILCSIESNFGCMPRGNGCS